MIAYEHICVNEENKSCQHDAYTDARSYQERLDSRFFGYGPEFRREGGDYLTLKNALHHILPQAVYRTWETSISRQQDEQLPYMGTARLANIIGVSVRKIQLDFQYLQQRHLLRRIPAMHSDGYPVHLLDYSGLYQLAHEYLVFKASPFGNIPPDPEFIQLAPKDLQAQLMHYHSYAAAMTHNKRGRKPRSTWTPLHAIHKIPLENPESDHKESPPIDIHQTRSLYTAKNNLQKNLKNNLKRISPYESESYDNKSDSSERDSNPSSLHNFSEQDSASSQEQRFHQFHTTQERPHQLAPLNQTSRQDMIQQEKAVIIGGAREAAPVQRWPRLHHSIESFITDISREFHDTAPASSISQARRIYFEQLRHLGLRMDQFYDLLVFFKAEALYAMITKRNPDGQPNRMAWFFAAIRNHIQRVLTWAMQSGAPRTTIVDAMLHLVPTRERKAATQAAQEPHHSAVDWHHAPTSQASLPQSHDDTLEHPLPVDETDAPLMVPSREVRAIDPRRLRVQQALTQIRPLVHASLFVRYDSPCRHCHNVVFAMFHGTLRCVLCQPSKDWEYSQQQRIAKIIKSLDEPISENRASSEEEE